MELASAQVNVLLSIHVVKQILGFPARIYNLRQAGALFDAEQLTCGWLASELLDSSSRNGQYCPIAVPTVDGVGGFNRLAVCAP